MKEEMIKEIARRLFNKIECEKISNRDNEIFRQNRRFNPYHSERKGMEQLLKMMGFDFEYGFDSELEICSITINGITVEKQTH